MLVQTRTTGPLQTNSHALIDRQNRVMVVVDLAPQSASQLIQIAEEENAQIAEIWLTHSHWDHIADVHELMSLLGRKGARLPKVLIHALDAPNLRHPGCDQIPAPFLKGLNPDRLLGDGEQLEVGRFKFQTLHTPGHSRGSVAFHCLCQNILFSGDTLFHKKMGTLSLPTAEPQLMSASLIKLASLAPQTLVYPGHGNNTYIERERGWIFERFGKGEQSSKDEYLR